MGGQRCALLGERRTALHAVFQWAIVVPLAEFRTKYKNRAFAYVLQDVVAFPRPVPYQHPSGAVIWVTLPEGIV